MRQIMTKASAIKIAVSVILFAVIITVFPLRLWHEDISTSGKEHAAGAVAVSGDAAAIQQFNAEYDHIDSIGVMLLEDTTANSFTLRVFNADFTLLREVSCDIDMTALPGYAETYINLDTEVGATYYYSLECLDGSLSVPYELTGNSGASNNGYMQYAGENKDAYNLITEYTYEQPLRKVKSLAVILLIAAIGAGIWFGMSALEKKIPALQDYVTLQWAIKIIGNPLVVAAAVFALICVGPLHMFSIYISDLVIMSLGVILLAAVLLYAINHDGSAEGFDLMKYMQENWQNLLQSVCIAVALGACVDYMNALYEVFHDIAWRKMAFFLGLGIIVTFTFAEIINWYNLALLAAGIAAARIYYVKNLPAMVDEYHVEAMLWTCRLMPLILILAAYVIRSVIHAVRSRENVLKRISIPYTVACIVMAAAMIIRRNTRYWPVMMTVIVIFIGFRYLFWEHREKFIDNICIGILLHFFGCMLYCLWHRPYEAFTYVRYPFVFHTVTITAEYLSLVFAAALVRLFGKYHKEKRIKPCIFEMFVFGTVTAYVLFTMSRTGMIAVVAAGFVMWIAFSFGKGKERFKSLLSMALIVIASVAVCFPITFTLQKAVPAVVGEAKIMDVEVYPDTLLVSTDWMSEDYITFSRFAKAFGSKMLGINEDSIKLDIYTINGRRTDLDNRPSVLDLNNDSGKNLPGTSDENGLYNESSLDNGTGILLTRHIETTPNLIRDTDDDSDFVPPHEYRGEGDAPEEFYDPDYWYYDDGYGDWIFNEWKVDEDRSKADVSNGRMDIYRSYLSQLTAEGHESMGAILDDGSEAAHAHDIYLQVAFDHGIIVGALFVLWVCFTCIQALVVFIKKKEKLSSAGLLLAVAVTYSVAGITEWISHPCNPVGMILLLVIVPMAFYKDGKDKETV